MTDRPPQGPPDEDRVRDVLRDLGTDHGAPMPPDLVTRIEASLAEERAHRESGAPVLPLATRRRRPLTPWLLGAAAAAAVAVVLPGVLDRASGPSSADSAAESVAGTDDPARTSSPPPAPTADDGEEATSPPFALTVSDRAYTESALPEQAAEALRTDRREEHTVPSFSAESPVLGPIATERGAADCLARLGAPDARPVLVDVGTFDGERGFLLIAEGDGQTQAWAVAAGCAPIYDAPVTLP